MAAAATAAAAAAAAAAADASAAAAAVASAACCSLAESSKSSEIEEAVSLLSTISPAPAAAHRCEGLRSSHLLAPESSNVRKSYPPRCLPPPTSVPLPVPGTPPPQLCSLQPQPQPQLQWNPPWVHQGRHPRAQTHRTRLNRRPHSRCCGAGGDSPCGTHPQGAACRAHSNAAGDGESRPVRPVVRPRRP